VTAWLRPAGLGDLGAIMVIERSSFPTDAWSEDAMAATLQARDSVAFAAEQDDRLVGYAAVLTPKGGTDADVLTIAVDRSARRTGVGRALLTRLLEAAAQRGARRVFLEVRDDNLAAQALYESEGFAAIGRRPRYYQPDDVDAIVMRLEFPGEAQA
jgi:ribosomal-protein-alanine N-acetyltransferase